MSDNFESQIQHTVDELYRTRSFKMLGSDHGMGGVISLDEANFLRDTVEKFGATRTLETGMGSGMSGVHICWGIKRNGGGKHIAIDPFQKGPDWKGLALDFHEHLGLSDMLEWKCEKSDTALAAMVRNKEEIDFAFIDGDHRFEGAMVDFHFIDQLLPVGGICAFDDADWPPVRRVVNFALSHRNYKIVGGSKVELGPLTRPWGWRQRMNRRRRYRETGWPANEANRQPLYETIVLQKESKDDRPWRFWANFD